MALARKCDRCGGFYIPSHAEKNRREREGEFNAIIAIDRTLSNKYYETRTYDLCPYCSALLLDWLNRNPCKEA